MSIRVKDEHRKHELSLTPGGSEVKTVLTNGKKLIYDKIKYVKGYCSRLIKDPNVVEIWVDDQLFWTRNK